MICKTINDNRLQNCKKREPKKAKSQKECISQVWFGKKLRNQMIYHLIYLTKVIVYFCLLRKITTKNHKLSTYWTWKFSSHKSSGGLDYVKEERGLQKYWRHFWNQQFDFQMLQNYCNSMILVDIIILSKLQWPFIVLKVQLREK